MLLRPVFFLHKQRLDRVARLGYKNVVLAVMYPTHSMNFTAGLTGTSLINWGWNDDRQMLES